MQPAEYVSAIMAGLGVIFQFGRSAGWDTKQVVVWLVWIAVLLTLSVSEALRGLVKTPTDFALWQMFVLTGILQFVGIIAAGLGGLYGTNAVAHGAVSLGANPASAMVPVTPASRSEENPPLQDSPPTSEAPK